MKETHIKKKKGKKSRCQHQSNSNQGISLVVTVFYDMRLHHPYLNIDVTSIRKRPIVSSPPTSVYPHST